jgi:hypothetical protein
MNAITLVVQGKDKPVALACGECGTVHRLTDDVGAERCCKPYTCSKCGVETRRYWMKCDDCIRKEDDAKEAARRAAATVVEWDDSIVILYDRQGDRWLQDEDDAADSEVEYAYATTPDPLHLDAESIVLNALEDHHEDADVDPHLVRTLQQELDAWCERTGVVSYTPDFSRVVVFAPEPSHD